MTGGSIPDIVTNMENKLQKYASELLLKNMREYSEDFWCAGWISNLEYDLWAFVCGDTETYGTYLSKYLDDIDREHLQTLANDAGGWYYWSEEEPVGEKFIAMDNWLEMYEERKSG